ncbi:MAG: alpha/beta hydrolase [Bdellovibrionaceae bacterium]|jgi:pimeloyl-ACP methyl ester carboxylesterase|nr:alpha/beta hydrolase [Pseudobdellovibrionaceae bacterium]
MIKVKKETGHFKSFDGTKIYYEVRGKGTPIIFCYGIGCLFNHWRHQIKYFSENGYKTIVFDYRAHHQSDVPEDHENLDMESLAKDIKGLTEHLKIKKAIFCSHSFGGQIMVKTFDLYPEIFSHLIFINGFISNPIKGMFGGDVPAKVFNFFNRGYDLLPETLTYLWKFSVQNPLAIPLSALAGGFNLSLTSIKDIEIYIKGIANLDLQSFLALFEQMMEYDGHQVLKRINVPTLIIGGKNDGVTPVSYQEELHRSIKDSELSMIPMGSHCTQLDLPDYVNLKIEKFIQTHKVKKPRVKRAPKDEVSKEI